ncbi:MAG: hypothetical protein KTR21_10065 [Rhodobacteraceae bacterium]|nr:hypothetical protein [Paracoccaceae bacterium]
MFQALFDTVLEEIEQNPEFAARLAERLPAGLSLTVAGRKKPRAEAPDELMAMDLKAARAEMGQIDLREKLANHTNAELAAFIRTAKLSTGAISGKNKTQLVNIILRASK